MRRQSSSGIPARSSRGRTDDSLELPLAMFHLSGALCKEKARLRETGTLRGGETGEEEGKERGERKGKPEAHLMILL